MEVYNPSMFGEVERLVVKGLLAQPYYVTLVMGVGGMGGYPGPPGHLVAMVGHLPTGAAFNVSGIGRCQLAMNTMAILMGGHARVGLEDNVNYRRGEPAKSSAQFVERIVRLARELGREVATPDEARAILKLRR